MKKITAKEAFENFKKHKEDFLKDFDFEKDLAFIYQKIIEHSKDRTSWTFYFYDQNKRILERNFVVGFKKDFENVVEEKILKPLLKDGFLVYLTTEFKNPAIYISWTDEIIVPNGLSTQTLKRENIEKIYAHLLMED